MQLISAVVCESVRQETNAKVTLVGAGDVHFSHIEGTFPKPFGLWVLFECDDDRKNINGVHIRGVCDRGSTHFETPKLKLERLKESPNSYVLGLNMPYQPLMHDGELEFFWSADKKEWSPIIKIYNRVVKKDSDGD